MRGSWRRDMWRVVVTGLGAALGAMAVVGGLVLALFYVLVWGLR